MKIIKKIFLVALSVGLSLLPHAVHAKRYPWNVHIPIPVGEPVYLVIKGVYDSSHQARQTQQLIQVTLKDIPADGVIVSDALAGFPQGKWVVASVFDTAERAQWWANFSHRNPTLPKPYVKKTTLLKLVELPYLPNSHRANQRRFMSEDEAINLVKGLDDVRQLQNKQGVKFLITDYPRSGDLRYEVEVLAVKAGKPHGVMYDFFMVDAVNQKVTERYSNLFKNSLKSAGR